MKRVGILSMFLLLCVSTSYAQQRAETPKPQTITEKVAGMERFPGFFPFYWDAKAGKIWLEIDKWNTEFLYVESLPAGIGSNDIGLDRGQLATARLFVSIAQDHACCSLRRITGSELRPITPMNVSR